MGVSARTRRGRLVGRRVGGGGEEESEREDEREEGMEADGEAGSKGGGVSPRRRLAGLRGGKIRVLGCGGGGGASEGLRKKEPSALDVTMTLHDRTTHIPASFCNPCLQSVHCETSNVLISFSLVTTCNTSKSTNASPNLSLLILSAGRLNPSEAATSKIKPDAPGVKARPNRASLRGVRG